jgi:outer membrane receptor protein involved in Fe transport
VKEREDDNVDSKFDHNLSARTTGSSCGTAARRRTGCSPPRCRTVTRAPPSAPATATSPRQGLAFNDTHTFRSNWLNEFRFGWTSVEFLMTSIDYGQNLADRMGIPGINLNQTTSAMTQITFQNIRNLGANGNQPLITNQNDFQIFDNVTWIKGRHTFKAGGSVTFRSREILNADQIVGGFPFNNNQTSNCAGVIGACTLDPTTGFDVASFLLGYASAKNRRLFDAEPYTEKRPEYAVYVQDDWRVSHKLTLNLGLRWDVYPPWIEVDDLQSNFDPSTGRYVVASPNAVINGVNVGRYLQTYSKRDIGPRLRVRVRPRRRRPHRPPRRLGRVLELHAGRHVLVQGAEPAVPQGAGDHPDAEQHRRQPAAVGRPAAADRGRSQRCRPKARPGRSSTSTSGTGTPTTST